jgi:hypothetical protein
MKYQKPAILASYSERELMAEAATCTGYGEPVRRSWFRWWG